MEYKDNRGGGFKGARRGPYDRPPVNDRRDGARFEQRRGGPPGPDRGRPFGDRPLPPQLPPIDREKVCPLLIRVFPRTGGHHSLDEFARRGHEPKPECSFYTWEDATLRELCELVQDADESAKRPNARLSFALIYPDRTGRNIMRQVGVVHSTRRGREDEVSLRSLKFQTGDFLSVAIYLNH